MQKTKQNKTKKQNKQNKTKQKNLQNIEFNAVK